MLTRTCGRILSCHSTNKASKCWEHLWDTRNLCLPIWTGSRLNTERSWKEFRLSLTSNPLGHCAAARATYLLRTLPPEAVARFADAHDASLWGCMCRLLNIPPLCPLFLGGLGLRSAARTRQSAFWASWADCLPMIRERHPELAEDLWLRLEGGANTSALGASRGSLDLDWSHGFHSTVLDGAVKRSSASRLATGRL